MRTNEIRKFLQDDEIIKKYIHKFDLLTKREIEILRYVSSGKTSKEIAGILFISKQTVDKHRKNINKKLGTKKLAELIKCAQAIKILSSK